MRTGRAVAVIVTVLAVVAGCSRGGDSSVVPTPQETAAAVNGCANAGADWRPVREGNVVAAELGTGPAVVFANDSGNSVCDWLPLARQMAGMGLRPIVFAYFDFSERQSLIDLLALADLRRPTARPFALVGASLGGRLVIEAAAAHPQGLAAIVSLSGERVISSYPDILPQARQVAVPALYVGAREDINTDGATQQNQLHAAMHGRPNDLIQLDGFDHGTDLIDDPVGTDSATVGSRISAFVRAQVGSGS